MSSHRLSRRTLLTGTLTAPLLSPPRSAAAAGERVILVAGGGDAVDGPATQAKLNGPFGVEFDRSGRTWIVELNGGRVLQIDKAGQLSVLAGDESKAFAGDGGPLAQAKFNGMHNLAIGPDGTVYLADTWNNRVRQVDPRTGVITTLAGTGEKGYGGDGGPAAQARFGGLYCASLDPKGENLYLADLDNRRIRKIDLRTRIVTTVAGNGTRGVPADGAVAAQAPLVDPRAVAVSPAGEVYVLERGGHALRVVSPDGKIRTVAGTGVKGAAGDGGEARLAQLSGPKHLCLDRDGTVVIADTDNHLIRRYDPRTGQIVRVAGCGRKGTAGVGGPPAAVELNFPHGVTVHRDGTLYIVDSGNNRILKLSAA